MGGTLSGCSFLVTGGMGYIGSHTALLLVQAGAEVTLLDNLSNAQPKALDHLRKLAGEHSPRITFVKGDIRSAEDLEATFSGRRRVLLPLLSPISIQTRTVERQQLSFTSDASLHCCSAPAQGEA